MALDPSISLQATPPVQLNLADAATKGLNLQALAMRPEQIQQEIAASKAQQANAEAQNPGIQAQSQSAQLKAQQDAIAMRQTQATIAATKNNTKINADGTTTFDPYSAAKELQANGFADAGFNMLKGHAESSSLLTKSTEDKVKLGNSVAVTAAQMLKAMPPEQRGQAHQFVAQHLASDPVLGSIINVSPLMTGLVSGPGNLDAVAAGSFTPKEQKEVAISQQNADTSTESTTQAGYQSGTGKAARDPNSPSSQLAVGTANSGGLATPAGTSAADLASGPQKEVVAASIVPAATKGAAVGSAVDNSQLADNYDAVSKSVKNLQAKGMLKPGTKIDAFLKSTVANVTNDPDYLALKASASTLPALNTNNVDANGLLSQATTLGATARTRASTAGNVAKATTFNQTPGAAATPAAPTGPSVKMMSRSGQVVDVPAGEAAAAKARGFRLVGGK